MGALGSHRAKSLTWRYGHTRSGKLAARRWKLAVEANRTPACSSHLFFRIPTLTDLMMCCGAHSAPEYRTFVLIRVLCPP